MLRTTRELYNALLQQRRDAWIGRGVRVGFNNQYGQITDLRRVEPRFAVVYRECEDAVLRRLDLAFTAYFRRLKIGDAPGYPRFKPALRWNQLEFPHGDRALRLNDPQQRIVVPRVGSIRLRKGRLIPTTFGRVFLTTKSGRWYATFECHRKREPMAATGLHVGIDRGVAVLAATSDGSLIANPRHAHRLRSKVERLLQALGKLSHRDVSGRVTNRRDPVRAAAVRRLGRAKEREANARRDWLHKVSRHIVDRYDLIAMEDLSLRAMTRSAPRSASPGRDVAARSALNRALLDAGLGILGTLIREKAEWAARTVIGVDPRYSSQTCTACGRVARESRKGVRFVCVACGFEAHADVNAAQVILLRAESQPMRAPGSARSGSQDAGLTTPMTNSLLLVPGSPPGEGG